MQIHGLRYAELRFLYASALTLCLFKAIPWHYWEDVICLALRHRYYRREITFAADMDA